MAVRYVGLSALGWKCPGTSDNLNPWRIPTRDHSGDGDKVAAFRELTFS